MSHAHNPTSVNMNLGNILGERASVAQSSRFRDQMRGSAVASALVSPSSKHNGGRHQQQRGAARAPAVPANEPIILTHRGGQQTGGTVWQNEDYWQQRSAQKRAARQQKMQQQQQQQQQYQRPGHGYAPLGGAPRPGTYPADSMGSARNHVPRLALGAAASSSSGLAARDNRPPPLKRRGGYDADTAGGPGAAGRGLLAGSFDFGDTLHEAVVQMGSRGPGKQQQQQQQQQQQEEVSRWRQPAPQPRFGNLGGGTYNHNRTGGGARSGGVTSPNMRTASSLRLGANARLGGSTGTQHSYGGAQYGGGGRQFRRNGGGGGGGQKTSRVF